MKWHRKILIILCSVVVIIIVVNIGLKLWVNYQLPKIINRENDSAYLITYKNIDISLFKSKIIVSKVLVVPKYSLKSKLNKDGIYGRAKTIEIKNFDVSDVLFGDKIKARSIIIEHPIVIFYKEERKSNSRELLFGSFDKIISVSDVFLIKGDLKIIHAKSNQLILGVQNITAQLEGIFIDEKIVEDKIPLHFGDYALSCDSIRYHPNSFYNIKIAKIQASKSDLNIDKFEMIPIYSRREFVSKIDTEKDMYTLLCKSIKASKMKWGYFEEQFFFHSEALSLDEAAANIYRSKEPADDLSKKHLYNKLLRDLKFDLKIDTLKISNSIIEYEEEKSFELGAGKLTFNRFNLLATSICSGFKKHKLPEIKIKVNCRFMNASPLNVDWRFNVMDKSDNFNISGKLTNFDTASMAPFYKSHINVTTEGIMDEVSFNFAGNDKAVSGEFAVKYDDLKFTIYKKNDRKKKNKLLTFVSRIFIKKDTNGKIKGAQVELERIPEKSFYNFLWRSVAEGLKKILV